VEKTQKEPEKEERDAKELGEKLKVLYGPYF